MTSKSWPALASDALFTDARGVTWAFGDDLGDHWGLSLDGARVLALPGSVRALARDARGVAWLGMNATHPLVRFDGDRFEAVAVPRAVARADGITHVSVSGEDVLIVADRDDEPSLFAECIEGTWHEHELPAGRAIALAVDEHRAWVAIARTYDPDRAGTVLVKRHDQRTFTSLAWPRAAGAWPSPVGLLALPEGGALLLTAHDGDVALWRVDDRGTFRRVPTSEKLVPWIGRIDACLHRGVAHLATERGVFVLSGKSLRRAGSFKAVSLWPIASGLACRGWRGGAAAHEVLTDGATRWTPFEVPLPGVVGGGHGKVVSMPPRRKVPVEKVRVVAPRAAPRKNAPAVALTPLAYGRFLELASKGTPSWPKESSDIAAALVRACGVKIAPDLRRWLSLFHTARVTQAIGLWRTWNGKYFPLPDTRTSRATLATVWTETPSIIGALTGTWALGADGGGQIFFAELDRARSEVFIYGPGVGQLKFLARSMSAFAALNVLEENWERFCEVTGFDDEDLREGAIDAATPALAALRQQARGLRGKVSLPGMDASDLESDFDALVNALAQKRLLAKSASPVLRRYQRATWLVGLLSVESIPSRAAIVLPRGAARAPDAATRLLATWHAFFVGEGGAVLDAALALARADRAPIVRATGALLRDVSSKPNGDAAFERLVSLRRAARTALGLA